MKLEKFKNLLFYLPIIKFKVKEKSMEPGIKEGGTVIVSRFHYLFKKPEVGDVVVLRDQTDSKRFIIKRIKEIRESKIFVVGENKKESIDSRQFGWIEINNIIGKVI